MTKLSEFDKNMPILVVDDYSAVRRVVKNCLAKLGFKNIAEAENGSAALELAKDNKYGLVISDWQMPDMEASDLISQISDAAEKVPCLMVVSENQKKQSLVEANKEEKADFIVKPFTVETLEEKMLKVLK